MKFINWDNRPAVLLENSAYAVLKPNEKWVEVDWLDVRETGAVMKYEEWEILFTPIYGSLSPLEIPDF